jgi:hypothetical protein
MLVKIAREGRTTPATNNFSKMHQVLASEFALVTKVCNSNAEKPVWQSRFVAPLSGETIFIDLIDCTGNKNATRVHIHNRIWGLPISSGAKAKIYEVLTKSNAAFYISGVLL